MSSYDFNCKVEDNIENESAKLWNKLLYKVKGGGGGKIGRHKIGAWNEMGQNRIKGGWGVQKPHKMWDIIYARSLITNDKQYNLVQGPQLEVQVPLMCARASS